MPELTSIRLYCDNWARKDLTDHYNMLPSFYSNKLFTANSLDLHQAAWPGATLSVIALRTGSSEMNTGFLFFLSIQN